MTAFRPSMASRSPSRTASSSFLQERTARERARWFATGTDFLEAKDGEVLVDGKRVQDDLVAARTRVGMVFQNPRDSFVAATVGADVAFGPENLGLARREIDRRVDEALAAVKLSGRGEDRIETLSGGEQERLAIAGALAMEPDHLVLDEPFTGLDEPSRQAVLDHVETLSATGTSVIVVTHDLRDVLSLADRLVVLSEGRVVRNGPPESVELAGLCVRSPC